MTSYFFCRVLQSFMIPNDELEKMRLPQIKINHLFFAMTFFVQKFDDKPLVEYLFKIFFCEGLDKGVFRLDKMPLEDPAFYSFEYRNDDIIGGLTRHQERGAPQPADLPMQENALRKGPHARGTDQLRKGLFQVLALQNDFEG